MQIILTEEEYKALKDETRVEAEVKRRVEKMSEVFVARLRSPPSSIVPPFAETALTIWLSSVFQEAKKAALAK